MKLLASVCGFVVALTIVCMACLSGAARADEASAVKAVEKLGGKVTRDDKLPGKPVIGVNLTHAGVTDAGLKELKDLKKLTSLNLPNTDQVTDDGVADLQKALPGCKITR